MRQSTTSPTANGIGLTWLGQAGFCFSTEAGKRVYLDPYLSDACYLPYWQVESQTFTCFPTLRKGA